MMRRHSWNVILVALGLVLSLAFMSIVAAQEATPEATPETEAQATPEMTQEAMEATPEASPAAQARPLLGIRIEDAEEGGAVVREVLEGSAAADAGLMEGDIITAVNGAAVGSGRELTESIAGMSVGDTVTLEVTRDDETMTVEATLGAAPEQPNLPQELGEFRFQNENFGFTYNDEDQTWEIQQLSEDDPLYEAGLREGDAITAIDGETRDPMSLLEYLPQALSNNDTIMLTVERDGDTMDIEVNPIDLLSAGFGTMFQIPEGGMRPGRVIPMQPGQIAPFFGGNGRLGVSFVTLDEQVAGERGVEATEGALVVEVVPGSPAEEAGLQANDVITAVNGEPVDAERTLRDRLIAYEPDDTVTLDVVRDGETQQIDVTLGQPEMSSDFMPFFQGDPNDMFRFFEMPSPSEITPEPRPNI